MRKFIFLPLILSLIWILSFVVVVNAQQEPFNELENAESQEGTDDQGRTDDQESTENPDDNKKITYKAEVLSVEKAACEDEMNAIEEEGKDPSQSCLKIKTKILNGKLKGSEHEFDADPRVDILYNEWDLEPGDKVVVTDYQIEGESNLQITELYRASSIIWFVIIYVVLVLLVGRFQGLGSLVGLGISIFVLLEVIIPMTLNGWNPLLVSILGGMAVLLPSIYFSHGFNYKTTIALFGTTLGLIVTGILAAVALEAVHLTGYGAEETLFLVSGSGQSLDMGSILLASIIIGGIGLIDDVTVGQVAVIREIYFENKDIDASRLYQKAMNVGKDHIASMVNTLFLAYAAASLPLVMVLVDQGAAVGDIANIESFAEEIIRTLVASSGLVLTVPITTLLAAMIYTSKNPMYENVKK